MNLHRMPLVMYHKTNNNNMTRQTEDEIEYGHFYDVEKDEYLDKYKHLKKIIIKQKKNGLFKPFFY